MLLSKLKAIDRKIRSVGVLKTLWLILIYIRNLLFYRRYLIYWIDLTATIPNNHPVDGGLLAREINNFDQLLSEDVYAVTNYTGQRYIKTIEERLAKNWTLYLGYVGIELGGAVWVVNDFSEFKSHNLPFVDRAVSIIDCWTIPKHRGKGVYPFLLNYVLSSQQNKNFQKVFIEVNEQNHPSIRGIEKAGFQLFNDRMS